MLPLFLVLTSLWCHIVPLDLQINILVEHNIGCQHPNFNVLGCL